jgi:poly-gamma-glutamate synthesis protein (capsule biosynthesis protein)
MADFFDIAATSEMILGMEREPEFYFAPVEPLLREAALVFGHLETPHTDRPEYQGVFMTPPAPMKNLSGLTYAHFDAVTLAGNPIFSYGNPGIEDTVAWLDEHNIAHTGAGMNIDEARVPMILEREGVKFGFLSYDSVGQKHAAATARKAGCAYVDILTHFEPGRFPGAAPSVYTFPEPQSLEAMREDIRALRPQCDILVVVLHMGMGMQEMVLADYEYQLPREAINEGADLIVTNHAHVLKGMEFYKGVPIYHCLCNLVTVFPWQIHHMFTEEPLTTLNQSRLRPRSGYSKTWLDLNTPNYPFPHASRKSMLGTLRVDAKAKKIVRAGFHPIYIDKEGRPIPVGRSERGEEIFAYMEKITKGAKLNAHYQWDSDVIVALPPKQ